MTAKWPILIGCSTINHPAIGVPRFMETLISENHWKSGITIDLKDVIFHCRLWPPAAAYDPPVSLGHRSSETNGLGVSSETPNQWTMISSENIDLFVYIYIYIHIYTYYTYSYYIYIYTCRSCLYIYYIPFFTYIDYVFVRIYLHSGFIGSNVWIVQTSSHLRACTGGHKGTDQAEPSWPRGVPWGWCLTSMLGAMGTMVLIVETYWILCESTCAMEKIMNTLHVSCCNRLCWLWESQSMHFTSGTWCCCFDHVRSHLF